MDIVCWDAIGISCGTWIAFWNGAIGALVAAVLGAAVAFLVVRLTNAQQRHGVERTVEIAALADCVAAMEGLEWAMRRYDQKNPFDVGIHMLPMRAAVARLQMSRKEASPVADILIHWPGNLVQLAEDYQQAVVRGDPFIDDILTSVTEVSTFATVSLPWCTSSKKVKKKDAMKMLRKTDIDLKAAMDKSDDRRSHQKDAVKSSPVLPRT